MRYVFDKLTGYPNNMNENRWLLRFVFLETVAGTACVFPFLPDLPGGRPISGHL